MIINPIFGWVFIEIPKTGSTSIREALKSIHGSFEYGRHIELCELPPEFHDYRVFTVFRNPMDRLQSLYDYMQGGQHITKYWDWFKPLHQEVISMPFSAWLLDGFAPFCGGPWPHHQRHIMPEQQKTQGLYLDNPWNIKTKIFHYEHVFDPTHPEYTGIRGFVGADFPNHHLNKTQFRKTYAVHKNAMVKHLSIHHKDMLKHYPGELLALKNEIIPVV